MIVDTSAVMAVLLEEPDAKTYLSILLDTEHVRMSEVTAVEAALVAFKRTGPLGEPKLDSILDECHIEIVPFDQHQLVHARAALRTYGKGRSPARLNFGDCFSYALAKATGEPLLFKGDDFTHTDIKSALA